VRINCYFQASSQNPDIAIKFNDPDFTKGNITVIWRSDDVFGRFLNCSDKKRAKSNNPRRSYCDFNVYYLEAVRHIGFDRKWIFASPQPLETENAPTSRFNTISLYAVNRSIFTARFSAATLNHLFIRIGERPTSNLRRRYVHHLRFRCIFFGFQVDCFVSELDHLKVHIWTEFCTFWPPLWKLG